MAASTRRVRYCVPFNGGLHEVSITAPSSGPAQVEALRRSLPCADFSIHVVTSGSERYGPARGLAPDDALPDADDEHALLFLIFDPKYIDRFPAPRLESAEAVRAHHARQVLAFRSMWAPCRQHRDVSVSELRKTAELLGRIRDQVEHHAALLPETIRKLDQTPLADDSSQTLGSRVGDVDAVVEAARDELTRAQDKLASCEAEQQRVEAEFKAGVDAVPDAARAPPSQQTFDGMRRALERRVAAMKAQLRLTERWRQKVGQVLQATKAVRDNGLLKLSMITVLPEAYAAALCIARRRLTFNRAAERLRKMLSVEHGRICDDIAEFLATYGARFPSNVLPGIERKPALPSFDDPVADIVRPSMVDLEEDPASQLLQELGLFASANNDGPGSAVPSSGVSPEVSQPALQSTPSTTEAAIEARVKQGVAAIAAQKDDEIAALRTQLERAIRERDDARGEAALKENSTALFEASVKDLKAERDALQKQVDELTLRTGEEDAVIARQRDRIAELEDKVAELTETVCEHAATAEEVEAALNAAAGHTVSPRDQRPLPERVAMALQVSEGRAKRVDALERELAAAVQKQQAAEAEAASAAVISKELSEKLARLQATAVTSPPSRGRPSGSEIDLTASSNDGDGAASRNEPSGAPDASLSVSDADRSTSEARLSHSQKSQQSAGAAAPSAGASSVMGVRADSGEAAGTTGRAAPLAELRALHCDANNFVDEDALREAVAAKYVMPDSEGTFRLARRKGKYVLERKIARGIRLVAVPDARHSLQAQIDEAKRTGCVHGSVIAVESVAADDTTVSVLVQWGSP